MRTMRALKEKFFSDITEIPPMLSSTYLPSLDGLRAISIIIVIVFHVLLKFGIDSFQGTFGVEIFFVISGFIITTLLLREQFNTEKISLRKFYIRRFIKIVPIAYCYLVVIGLLNLHYHNIEDKDLLASFLFLKNAKVMGTGLTTPPGHFWSLSVEEQFYLFFPFILARGVKAYLIAILTFLFLVPIALILENKHAGPFALPAAGFVLDFFRFIIPILVGALTSVLIFKKVITGRLYPNNLFFNVAILVIAYFLYANIEVGHIKLWTRWFACPLIAMMLVNNISDSNDLFFRFLNAKWMVRIGIASYSLYIWQQLFLLEIPWAEDFPFTNSVWFGLPASLIVGFASYYFIEKKLVAFRKRFK